MYTARRNISSTSAFMKMFGMPITRRLPGDSWMSFGPGIPNDSNSHFGIIDNQARSTRIEGGESIIFWRRPPWPGHAGKSPLILDLDGQNSRRTTQCYGQILIVERAEMESMLTTKPTHLWTRYYLVDFFFLVVFALSIRWTFSRGINTAQATTVVQRFGLPMADWVIF